MRSDHVEYTLWSSDFHISGPADVKDVSRLLPPTYGLKVIDESLSGACHLTHSCATDLKILSRANGIDLTACPNHLKRQFWLHYRSDADFDRIDAFIFTYAVGLSELFMAFSRPLIIIAPTRYEVGRTTAYAWQNLNENLHAIAKNPRNTVVANNLYDAEYIKHFTGLKDVKVLPNLCGYTNSKYMPSRHHVLIGPGRLSPGGEAIQNELLRFVADSATSDIELIHIRKLYTKFEYADLAAHPAIVLIPYQVSIMSIMEYYRMGIPLFAPSLKLLVRWQLDHLVMNELSWNCVHKKCEQPSAISPHRQSPHGNTDPNRILNETDLEHWLLFADFYQWPAITYFDDWSDLLNKLRHTDYGAIHREMMLFNEQQTNQIVNMWQEIIFRAFSGFPPRKVKAQTAANLNSRISWEQAILSAYPGISASTVHKEC